jgi:ADP-ribose pyrophosphatase YjhB (NUDIX family)
MKLKLHHRLLQRGFLLYSRLARGMTLGVRAMLIEDDHVILVKHSYVPGWHFPGGGVEPGESLGDALAREILEEVGAVLRTPPQLFGVYRNKTAHHRDHVALFVCREWDTHAAPRIPNLEIIACQRFPVSALPADVSHGTLARMREVLSGRPPSSDW